LEERKYFETVNPKEKEKYVKILKKLNSSDAVMPLRLRVLGSSLPDTVKSDIFRRMKECDSQKYETWVNAALRLPIGILSAPPGELGGITDILNRSRAHMDNAIYGHENAKAEVLRMMCQWVRNGSLKSFSVGFEGPPGIGKTTFAKAALNCLGRPFAFISLGGASDSAYLLGHSFTYEGAICGRIAEALSEARTMDPIIYFDELDKLSKTTKGEEISSILTHLTDPEQSACFRDKYFHGINLDLSNAIFVFSYNNADQVNPILLDRIKRIRMDSPTPSQKREITKNYLLPKQLSKLGLQPENVSFDESGMDLLIERSTDSGVRSIQKDLSHVIGELSLSNACSTHLCGGAVDFPYTCNARVASFILKDRPPDGNEGNVISLMYA
jgi:ATP-dependent Lon protease